MSCKPTKICIHTYYNQGRKNFDTPTGTKELRETEMRVVRVLGARKIAWDALRGSNLRMGRWDRRDEPVRLARVGLAMVAPVALVCAAQLASTPDHALAACAFGR